VHLVQGNYDDALVDVLAVCAAKAIGFEAPHVSVATHAGWAKRLGTKAETLRPTERLVEVRRAVKDAFEIDCLRRAAAGLGTVAEAAFGAVAPGVEEREGGGRHRGRAARGGVRTSRVRHHRRLGSQRRTAAPSRGLAPVSRW
jgi:Xaa-Pro aminopeptidase